MENIVKSLKVRCAAVGTDLTKVCRRAGVTRTTLRNWENETPSTLKKYFAVLAVIQEMEKEQADADNADAKTISA